MELSVFGLSNHFDVAPRTIELWLMQGKLLISPKNSNYQFRTNELEHWASKHNISLNLSDKSRPQKERESITPLSIAVQNGEIHFDGSLCPLPTHRNRIS